MKRDPCRSYFVRGLGNANVSILYICRVLGHLSQPITWQMRNNQGPYYVKKLKVASNLMFFCNLQTHLYDIHKVCIQIESQLPIGISNRSLLRYASPNRDKNQNEYVSIKMGFFFALLKNLFLFGKPLEKNHLLQ